MTITEKSDLMLSSHFIGEITEQQVALEFLKQRKGNINSGRPR